MRTGRVVAAAAALLVITSGAVSAQSRPPCSVNRADGWVSLPEPSGLSGVTAVAPTPTSARRLLATDGTVVVASTDGGCTWAEVFQVSLRTHVGLGQDTSPGGIEQVLVEGRPGDETVWLGQTPVAAGAVETGRLDVGSFGGPFTQASGLPAVGRLHFGLATDGRHGYAVAGSPQGDEIVYASSDSGLTWTQRGGLAVGAVTDVEVDPSDPARVFVLGDEGLHRSEDAGQTWTRVVVGPPTAITAGSHLLTAFSDGRALVSHDGGRHFDATAAPGGVVTADTRGQAVVVATRFGVFGKGAAGGFVDFSPQRLLLQEPRLALGQGTAAVVAHTASSILLYPLEAQTGFRRTAPPAPPVNVTALRSAPRTEVAPVLSPAAIRVSLGSGGSTTVPYTFRTPPDPGPLDVYFLVDTTASMESALNGLRRSIQTIIDSLAATGLDVQFGVGDFRDVDQLASDPLTGYVYRRDQPIAPPGPGLARALAALQTANGTDQPEAQTIALEQAATGSGMPGLVKAGQEAGFRPGSTRVVVLVTDSPFHQDAPYPSVPQAVTALNSVSAKVLGIAVATNLSASDPRPDERAVAAGTATLAPARGIDCDGDGEVDVEAGRPAVCEALDGVGGLTNVGDPILSLLDSVEVPGELGVTVSGHAVRTTAGALVRQVDLAKSSSLPFTVTYACARADAGKSFLTTLTGRIGTTAVVSAHAEVRCLTVPVRPRPAVAPQEVLAPLVPALLTALPPPPPPAQLPNANPNVNPNVQPNINPVAVAERQHQLEIALAEQEAAQLDVEPGTELAMSSRRRTTERDAAGALLGMVAVSSLAAVAVARQRRTQPAR